MRTQRVECGAYKVAVGILLRLVAPAIQKDGGTLLLGTGNQVFDALLALGADDRAEIGALFETSVDVESLGSLGHLRQPLFGFADHDNRAQGHAPLSSGTKRSTDDGVQGLVLVAVGQHRGMVLRTQVGLDPLAIGRAPGVDVFTRAVAANKADGFNSWLVENEVNGLGRAMDDVDHTWRKAGLPGQLSQDHGSPGVPFRRLKDYAVTGNRSDRNAPQRDHCGEVWRGAVSLGEGTGVSTKQKVKGTGLLKGQIAATTPRGSL